MSYDTGDKSIQCGRKVDAFKFWFMLKARGEDYMEDMVDNTFAMADHLARLVTQRPGFRLVPAFAGRQCTNVGFWFIPPSLRGQEETEEGQGAWPDDYCPLPPAPLICPWPS